jgi:NitT/TauT family transport system substrate-binding protein
MKGGFLFKIFIIALFLCLGTADVRASEKPVRIGYLQSDIHQLACWVALERGLYKGEGVNVQVAGIFKAGPEQMSAFAAGALDMGYVGEAPATTARANGAAKVTVLAQVNTEGSGLVVGKDSAFRELSHLVGKIVAIPGHATVQDFLLKKALAGRGIDHSSPQVMVIKPPEMIGALRTNQVQGFIAWQPYPAKAVTMGIGRVLMSSSDIWREHPCCVLVADDNFLAQRPDDARAMVRAHVKATDFINSNKDEAVKIAVKYTGMDEETVKLAMQGVRYTYEISREGELEYVRFLAGLGYIKVQDPEAFVAGFLNGALLKEIKGR